jgi:periplasmic divalent cation tolerance protein
MPDLVQVLTTFGSAEDATEIARTLVNEHLAACAQIIPGITSIYMWEGMLKHDDEALLLLKTTESTWPALRDRLAELHPYDTPEIIAIPVSQASYTYLAWVRENTN